MAIGCNQESEEGGKSKKELNFLTNSLGQLRSSKQPGAHGRFTLASGVAVTAKACAHAEKRDQILLLELD